MPGPPVSIRQCQFSRCGRAFSREAGARGAAMLRRHADAEGRMHRSTEPSCRPSASAHRAKNAHPFALARAQELPVQSSRAQLTSRPRESIRARLWFAPAPPPGQRPRVCADHLPGCSQPHRHHVAGHPFEYVRAEDCLPRGMALPRRQLAVPTHDDDAGGGLGFELHSAGPLALALACPLYYRKRDHHHHHHPPPRPRNKSSYKQALGQCPVRCFDASPAHACDRPRQLQDWPARYPQVGFGGKPNGRSHQWLPARP